MNRLTLTKRAAALALLATVSMPTSAWAMGFGLGCSDLPEYARAAGVLEGMSTCDMSVEQARRIVAAQQAQQGGPYATYQQPAPTPRLHHRHHHLQPSQP